MSKSIGIISIKGGVGKTTIASALAVDLANNYGKKVLLVDANFSAPNLGEHMDVLNPEKTIREVLAGQVGINSALEHRYGVDVLAGSFKDYKGISVFKLKRKILFLMETEKQYLVGMEEMHKLEFGLRIRLTMF